MKLTNRQYDLLKFIVMYVIPPVTTMYVALAGTWNLPHAQEISASMAAITTCLVSIIGSSEKYYKKGEIQDEN